MEIRTICWKNNSCRIIDQTLLPTEYKEINIETVEQMFDAIKTLKVRGAPAIGIAAAFGIYLGVREYSEKSVSDFLNFMDKTSKYLLSTRPTAVNLFYAVDRIKKLVYSRKNLEVDELKEIIFLEAQKMIEEDNKTCKKIGEYGASLLKDGDTILTHCNAGGLATASYGTALAPIYTAKEQGKKIKVFADETRPLLQGARLTTWELKKHGVETVLICDNMSASVMLKGWIDIIIVGADRICVNGDFANKIGTYGVAVLAKEHGIPFYVAAPDSTVDRSLNTGDEIIIEERSKDEVSNWFGTQTAPNDIGVYNPAFDVTPSKYVTGFITENGILTPPFK